MKAIGKGVLILVVGMLLLALPALANTAYKSLLSLPEPGSLLLMGAGLVILGTLIRRALALSGDPSTSPEADSSRR